MKAWNLFYGSSDEEVSCGDDHDDEGEEEGEVDTGNKTVGPGTLDN